MYTLITEPLYVIYIMALAVSICISCTLIGYLWRRRTIAVIPVINLLGAIIFYSSGYLIDQVSYDISTKLFMFNFEYVGIATIPVFFLLFAFQYYRLDHLITRRRVILLFIIPVITILLVWTKDFNSLMYRETNLLIDGHFYYIEAQYGTWFWIFLAYSYVLIAAGMAILILAIVKKPLLKLSQKLIIAFIVIPPFIANVIYVFRLLPGFYIDWTGPAFAISALCMTIAITNQRLLDFLPIARDMAIEMLSDGYVVLDGDSRILDLNEAMQTITGLSAEKAIGKKLPETISRQMNLQTGEASTIEIAVGKQRNKRYYSVHCSPRNKTAQNNEGMIVLFSDITKGKQIEKKLAAMATHDYLTGLPNRILLEDRFRISLARAKRNKGKFAIMVCDIDNFKMLNDTYGHFTADKILQATARRIHDVIRAEDTLSRIGGDEFVMLLSGIANENEPDFAAQRIMSVFRDTFSVDDHEINVSLSIGISLYPDNGTDIETLLKTADDAMYIVKGQGKANYHIANGINKG